jgi:UDP-N-acetylmuramoylalanine--D-glutamate ligase
MNETAGHIFNGELVDPRMARSVCILGQGVTGEAVAAYFRSRQNPPSVTIFANDAEVTGSFDLAVISPGIAPHSALAIQAGAHARELIGEPELAFRLSPERWCAVTGTNGKTTTTALITHVFNTCGIKARAVGNIGATCIEAVQEREPGEYLVAELSSYQLAYANSIRPEAAVLLNITPDHLFWHGSFEAYREAKLSLFERMDPNAPAVIDATLAETRAVVRARREVGRRVIPLGTAEGIMGDMTVRCGAAEAAFVDPDTSMLTCVIEGRRVTVVEASQLRIKGEHNQQNALAAASVALALGVKPEKLARGLQSFEPLEHRIEPCGTIDNIAFFNDSKATNPEATLKALVAFDGTPLVTMLGGRDKNTPLDELVEVIEATCRTVVCYGEAGSRFAEAFAASKRDIALVHLQEPDFRSAFDTAVANARPGDCVLLSPACASFDEFSSYEHRGTVFKSLVATLRAEREGKEANHDR